MPRVKKRVAATTPSRLNSKTKRGSEKAAMGEILRFVPVPPEDEAEPLADYLGSIFREFAYSPEVESTPFQIIGILAVQRNLHSVLVTPRLFFDDFVDLMPETAAGGELSEEQLRDGYTLVSERVADVAPYEQWKAKYEQFEALDPAEKKRQTAASLVAMLLLPDQYTHPVIRRRLLDTSDA